MNRIRTITLKWASTLMLFAVIQPAMGQQSAPALSSLHTDTASAVLLQAMSDELERSKSQLKIENVPAPYYIEYRLSDSDEYDAEAAFGALRVDQRIHARSVRVVVRVGDYKQDSYYGPGVGTVSLAPIDNDAMALRWQLWIATDQAYKAASEALAMKNAALRQYTAGQPFNDFARAPALQSIEPVAKLDFDPNPWKQMIEKSTALFRRDPKIESLSAGIRFRAVNQYFVNSEGTVTRSGYTVYSLHLFASTQADDGMRLGRSPDYIAGSLKELPTPDQFQADTLKMLDTLKNLREAPVVDEDYRGPILFSADAASELFEGMVGRNLLGIRPRPGDSARTTGDYASKFKSRVLPAFLSVIDDPTQQSFGGKTLVGAYAADDEGVRASKVPVIQDGMLVNYLLGREPIRDFPDSNGHGRAGPGQLASPNLGVLMIESKQASSPAELKQKLIEICRQ
ncbi:MAG TPA: metallopeptidase TldD-related protein, partial [Verrucomicrobiae bacterium]|nr:metallopeptidase TldD-related protein [Verrucomicrobiae bacterium]